MSPACAAMIVAPTSLPLARSITTLTKPSRLAERARLAELADELDVRVHVDAPLARLGLGEADGGHLGIGERDARHGRVGRLVVCAAQRVVGHLRALRASRRA